MYNRIASIIDLSNNTNDRMTLQRVILLQRGLDESPIEEERTLKVRITNRNYQINNEERRRRGKSKEKQAGRGEDRIRYPPRSDLHSI